MRLTPYSSFLSDRASNWITILLFLFAAVLPWTIAGMQIGIGLVALFMLIYAAIQRDAAIFCHKYFLLLLLFIVLRLISAALSPDAPRSISYVLNNDWIVLLVPLLAAALANTRRLRLMITVLLVIQAICGIYGVFQMFDGYDYLRQAKLGFRVGTFFRASGTFGHPLTYAGNQMMAFALAASLFLGENDSRKYKKFYGIVGAILLCSILASYTRSTWIATIVIIVLFSAILKKKEFRYVLIALIIGVFGLTFTIPEIYQRIYTLFDPSFPSNEGRINLWRTSLNMFVDAPVWGIGPGMYTALFEKYMYPGLYGNWLHAHNDYLNVLAQSGIMGLISWLGLWIGYYVYALRVLRSKTLDSFKRTLLRGSILGVTAILIASIFQCYYTDLENNIYWWFTAALGISIFVEQDFQNNTVPEIE